jgi:hypothetical protein
MHQSMKAWADTVFADTQVMEQEAQEAARIEKAFTRYDSRVALEQGTVVREMELSDDLMKELFK